MAYSKRSHDETDAGPAPKKPKVDESKLKAQSNKLFSLQKKLEEQLTKRQLAEIFEANGLHVPPGVSRMVEWCVVSAS